MDIIEVRRVHALPSNIGTQAASENCLVVVGRSC